MSVETPTIEEEKLQNTSEERELLPEVAELEMPIRRIIEQIKPQIETGEYPIIIGDDASGRIPTRIIDWFMREIYREKGFPAPKTIFIPGRLSEELCRERLSGIEDLSGRKVLIVTDTVKSGSSLHKLCGTLKLMGAQPDIVTIGREGNRETKREAEHLLGKIISGDYEDFNLHLHTPRIYRRKEMSGVRKNYDGGSVSGKYSIPVEFFGPRLNQEQQDSINSARKDAKIIAQRLIEWYKQTYANKE